MHNRDVVTLASYKSEGSHRTDRIDPCGIDKKREEKKKKKKKKTKREEKKKKTFRL